MSYSLRQVFLCFIAILGLSVYACSSQEKSAKNEEEEHHDEAGILEITAEAQQKAGLKFEKVREGQITNLLRASGKVVSDESRVFHLRPMANGRIDRIFVTPGSSVTKGQPLIAFDYVELGELQNDYVKARASASVSEQALKRAEHLSSIGALPHSEYEKRKADHQNSLAQIQDIEFKLQRYDIAPSQLTESASADSSKLPLSILRSPANGVLIHFDAATGEVVDPGRELLTVADLSRIWVEANVHETDLTLVMPNQKTEIRSDAYPNEIFSGTITKIGDMLDVSTRTVKVRCEVSNPNTRLKLEMFVHVMIPTSQTRQALLIPAIAVQEIDHKPVVFVRSDEKHFVKRNIETGEQKESEIEVLSGLKVGETLVTDGSFSLKSEFLKAEIGSDEHGH